MKISDWALLLLFGHQVGDSDQERKVVTYRYKRRQNKLVALTGGILSAGVIYIVWAAANQSVALGITVAFAALYLTNIYALACASDAIFNSLFERINLQSEWLRTRLDYIELATGAQGEKRGQRVWQEITADTDIQDSCYHQFPERPLERDNP